VFDVEVRAQAREIGGNGRGIYIGRYGVDRTGSNPPTIIGVGSLEKFTVGDGSNWTIEVTVVDNDVHFSVIGQLALTVRWALYTDIQGSDFAT
jgi:hypothetical protein